MNAAARKMISVAGVAPNTGSSEGIDQGRHHRTVRRSCPDSPARRFPARTRTGQASVQAIVIDLFALPALPPDWHVTVTG